MSLSPSPPPPPRPPRRQFMFKRANLGAPDTATTGSAPDTTSFFSRREDNYTAPVVVTKKPKRSKKKGTSDGSPPKRARGNDGSEGSGDDHAQGSAKQRSIIVSESDDGELATTAAGRKQRPKSKPKPRKREVSLTPPPILYVEFPQDPPISPIPISRRPTTTSAPSSSSLQHITLDSDTEAPTPVPAPAISAEDALFANLEKRAREKAAATNPASALSPPPPEPIVSLLITSPIEKTQPLVLRLRASQTLKAARTTWCQRQGFSADQAADIFLTWRGNKIFDHNSCRGMGIVESSDENVHLLAVTAEGYAEMERERERRYLQTEAEEVVEEEEEKEEVVMRLTLRSKGAEDFKIKVRPDTKISKLIAAYRITNKIPDEKEIRLDFDGDDLDPDQTVGDTELDDLFSIDVYIS